MKRNLRLVSVLLTVVLVMGTFVTPVAAGQGNGRGQASVPVQEIHPLDAEVRVIDGQPVFVYETKEGYEKIPFSLPEYAYADGQKMPLQTQGNDILLPTEEGLVAVPLEEFDVAMVAGEVMLLTEVNPWWTIPVLVAIAALIKAGVAVTTAAIKAASVLILTGQKVTAWSVAQVKKAIPKIKAKLTAAGIKVSDLVLGAAVIDWALGNCIMPHCDRDFRGPRWTLNPAEMVCEAFPRC